MNREIKFRRNLKAKAESQRVRVCRSAHGYCRLRVSEIGTAGLSNAAAVRGKEMRTDGVSPLRCHQKTPRPVVCSEKVKGKWTSDKVLRQIRKATQVSLRLTSEAIITDRCHKAANCIRAACDDQTFHQCYMVSVFASQDWGTDWVGSGFVVQAVRA